MALCCAVCHRALDIRMHTATTWPILSASTKSTNTVQVPALDRLCLVHSTLLRTQRSTLAGIAGVRALRHLPRVFNLTFTHGILFEHIADLNRVTLPWGEQIAFGVGPANPWRLLPDLAWFIVLAYALDASDRAGPPGRTRAGMVLWPEHLRLPGHRLLSRHPHRPGQSFPRPASGCSPFWP
jgi:hypothetical protein